MKKVKMSRSSFTDAQEYTLEDGGKVYVADSSEDTVFGYLGDMTVVINKKSGDGPPAVYSGPTWNSRRGTYPNTTTSQTKISSQNIAGVVGGFENPPTEYTGGVLSEAQAFPDLGLSQAAYSAFGVYYGTDSPSDPITVVYPNGSLKKTLTYFHVGQPETTELLYEGLGTDLYILAADSVGEAFYVYQSKNAGGN